MIGRYYDYPFRMTQLFSMGPRTALSCGLGFLVAKAKFGGGKGGDDSYEEYVVNRFGRGIYDIAFKGYAEKVWGDPRALSADLARTRIAIPGLGALLASLVFGAGKTSAAEFRYPRRGIIELSKAMAKRVRGSILLGAKPTRINVKAGKIAGLECGGRRFAPDAVVSTAYLNDLVSLLKPKTPREIRDASAKLRYRPLTLYYLVVRKPRVLEDNWIFFPEKEFSFNRVSEQKNFSDFGQPKTETVVCAEVTGNASAARVARDLEKAGLVARSDVDRVFTRRIERAYPIYDAGYAERLQRVLDYVESIENLYSSGRQGLFNYNNMDHCIDMGSKLASHLLAGAPKEEWRKTRAEFSNYRIVD
jgi:protoporphyrinogen oxidase